jgi:hypothetical protein
MFEDRDGDRQGPNAAGFLTFVGVVGAVGLALYYSAPAAKWLGREYVRLRLGGLK